MNTTVTLKNGAIYKIQGNPQSALVNGELVFLGRFITRSQKQEDFGIMVALLVETGVSAQVTIISTLQEPMAKLHYYEEAEIALLDSAREIEAYLGEER